MSNTNSASGPVVPCPSPACGVTDGHTSESVAISSANVGRLLSIQRELLPLTSGRPEAARLLEEMGRIVGPLAANPKDATKPIAYDPFFQVLGNPDILVHGLLFTDKPGLATIARVSKRWKSVLDGVEDKLWAGIAHRDEPLLFSAISGKSGRQWRDFLKRRFIMDVPPRVIRQPESSLLNLDKYVFELDFEVVVGHHKGATATAQQDEGLNQQNLRYEFDSHFGTRTDHAVFSLIPSAATRDDGGILLCIGNAEEARRFKVSVNKAVMNSGNILGRSSEIMVRTQNWKLRVTDKETMKSAFLLNDIFTCHCKYFQPNGFDRYTFRETDYSRFTGNQFVHSSDGHLLCYPGESSRMREIRRYQYSLSTEIRDVPSVYVSFESFLVSNEEVNFHIRVFTGIDPDERQNYRDLAFLFDNLNWGYY